MVGLELRIPLYVFFGTLPSLIWLFYYLKKDIHPEPKRMIVTAFLYGALITVPVFFIQVQLSELLRQLQWFESFRNLIWLSDILKWFVVIAVSEELFKYLAVRLSVFKSAELDEPLDVMIYMVTVALGFAALENILYLFSPVDSLSLTIIVQNTITVSFIRFVGATALHALWSALVGYFVVLSFVYGRRALMTGVGLVLAIALHGLYNFSIISLTGILSLIIPLTILIGLTITIAYAFKKAKKLKGVCIIKF